MSCIKKQAMMEPLVDTVDQNQIVTNSQLLKVGNTYACACCTASDKSFVLFMPALTFSNFLHSDNGYIQDDSWRCFLHSSF